ncbi:hypothetical protein [Pelosinus sp. IPA-1]|uniref:hypothetical protein n=1 Tax=Pelosinus sp. IPA-1 TaxID=3029569 RepID=UPI0024362764|nr:hypothetical protein [Pelosinus sp. IPA-1]GMB00361.1 hypothetical protein PIPA1_31600 [Pelosinus sp. IPA-1]
MEKIIEQVQAWNMLGKLPKEFVGFTLTLELEKRDTQYCIFTYKNEERHRSFSVLYDHATKEYFARTVIGLMEYYDVNFIVGDIEQLESLLVERLRAVLTSLASFTRENLDSILLDKKVIEWPYNKELPQQLFGFELFIRPDEPIKIINGSYIILDYSDFRTESNLAIYYNIFRDEFFGETRIRRTPTMAAVFDANNLDDLQEALASNLTSVLESLRAQID